METPRQDRDLGGRSGGAGRYFTREQLEGALSDVEQRELKKELGLDYAFVRSPEDVASVFSPTPRTRNRNSTPGGNE